jgi:hypothetical protein
VYKMYKDQFDKNSIILIGQDMLKRYSDIFMGWGVPMPPNYIFGNFYYLAHKHVNLDNQFRIDNKSMLNYVKSYIPPTFFEYELIVKKQQRYYVKDIYLDNGQGIVITNNTDLPPIVPKNYIVQEELVPRLINQCKFDLRVLVCIRRDNQALFIYKNILYRFAKDPYDVTKNDIASNLTHLHFNQKGFFYNDVHKRDPEIEQYHDLYITQLEELIPKIYNNLLPVANKMDNVEGPNHFYIHGMDFMPDSENKLYFLELNSPFGFSNVPGIHNYQDFLNKATKFMIQH